MADEEYKRIFAQKLNYYMSLNGKNQMDLMKDLHLSSSTVSNWCTGLKMPRMGKLQMLANYFNIQVSDLLEETASEKENGLYYLNPETARIAQQVYDNPDTRLLFDAARGAKPQDIKLAAEMLQRLKESNPDG